MGAELHFCSLSELGGVSKVGRAEGVLGEVWLRPGALTAPWTIVSRFSLGPLLHPPPCSSCHLGQCLTVPKSQTRSLGSSCPSQPGLLMMSLLQ